MTLQAPPHDPIAEEAVIGGVLFDPRALVHLRGLCPDDIYSPVLRAIYEAALEVDGRDHPVDMITVAEQMRRMGTIAKLTAHGGEAYLAELSAKVSTVENITAHSDLIRGAATKRRLAQAAHQIVQRVHSGAEAGEVAAEALALVNEATSRPTAQQPRRIQQLVVERLRALELRRQATVSGQAFVPGITYGFERLDAITGGMRRGQQVVLAGETGRGKTSLALQVVAAASVHALIFSLEMPEADLVDRMLCQGGADGQRFDVGHLNDNEWPIVHRRGRQLHDLPISFAPGQEWTIEGIRQETRRWIATLPPAEAQHGAIVLIDYLQLIEPVMSRRKGRDPSSREQEVAMMSRMLKTLALTTGAVVIVLSQLNEAGELRESRAIGQNADTVLIIGHDEDMAEDRAVLRLPKNRKGPKGSKGRVRLSWHGPTQTFAQHPDQEFKRRQRAAPAPKAPEPAQTRML